MSILFHGTWLSKEQSFFVWAETTVFQRPKGRRAAVPRHPFHESAQNLCDALARVARPHAALQAHTATVWLPSTTDAPIPSPELVAMGAAPPPDPAPTLAPWRVSGVVMAVSTAQSVVLTLPRHPLHRIGSDLQAWHSALLVALTLLAGQQVRPTIRRHGFELHAGWEIAPTPAMATTLLQLARAFPPLCRAVVADPETAPGARVLLDDFLAAVVATTLRTVPFTPSMPAASPGGRWLAALAGADSGIQLKGAAADALYRAWSAWSTHGQVAGTDSFRITFRLEAPEHADAPWQLAYLLQASDDPSLLVPVSLIWHETGSSFTYLERRFDQPHDRLLAGLGAAARLFAPIATSLYQAAPDRALLTAEEAFSFLNAVAPLLAQHGFTVLVPAWWHTRTAQLKTQLRAQSPAAQATRGLLSLESLVAFDWHMSLAGEPLTEREFERLVQLKQPLLQIRGQWIVLDPETLKHALACLTHPTGEMAFGDLVRLKLTGDHPTIPVPLDAAAVSGDGWLDDVLTRLSSQDTLELRPPPAGLHATLRPYQERGYSWLSFLTSYGLGACLADDMGIGKTIQTIAFLLATNDQRPADSPALVVCPTSVVGNWLRELNDFAPGLRVLVHRGIDRLQGVEFIQAAQAADIVLTSFPLLTRDRGTLQELTWNTVVLDEAQNIKNPATKQAQAAKSLTATHRIALTGTPVENRLSDLWSILSFLNPGYLGSQASFERTFARPIERTGDPQAIEQLRRLTAPFILRRLKTDRTIITDLPDKIETKVYCGLTKEQVTLYEAVVREALSAVEDEESHGTAIRRRGLVLAMLVKLKQICNHPALFVQDGSALAKRSGKLARVTELLEEIVSTADRALLFTQFATFGGMLQRHLQETLYEDVLFLHGGTPASERDQLVRQFQAPAGPKIFILSLKAGGTGLNLTAANHVFHIDRWWNPAVEQQATDRAFRIGQRRNVQVHTCLCSGTLEETIDALIERKRALAASVLGSDERWLTALSTAELRALVTLRTDMLEEV